MTSADTAAAMATAGGMATTEPGPHRAESGQKARSASLIGAPGRHEAAYSQANLTVVPPRAAGPDA